MHRSPSFVVVALLALSVSSPAAAAGLQAPAARTPAECPPQEGKTLSAPLGLTLCTGIARIEIHSIPGIHEGVRVQAVDAGSRAEQEGLRAGDVIYQIAGQRVKDGADAAQRLQKLRSTEMTVINFWRNGHPFLVRVRGADSSSSAPALPRPA